MIRNRITHTGILLAVCGLLLLPVAARAQTITARIDHEPDTVYAGQTFSLTLSLTFSGLRMGKDVSLTGLPAPALLELEPFRERPVERVVRGTEVLETRRFVTRARALRSGVLNINPSLRVQVLRRQRLLLGSAWEETERVVNVSPITLQVKPLPPPPAAFSGSIGTFSMTVTAGPSELAPGDIVTGVIRIEGDGSLAESTLPRFGPGTSFKVYEPTLMSADSAYRRVIEQVMIPQSTNATRIAPVSFTYFDPRKGAYRTLTQGPFILEFREAERRNFVSFRPEQSPDGIDAVESQISYASQWNTLSGSSRVLVIVGLLAGILIVVLVLHIRHPIVSAGVLAGLAIAGISIWFLVLPRLQTRAGMITSEGTTARLAPAATALSTFELPANSQVRILQHEDGWSCVMVGDRSGWIPSRLLTPATE